MASILKSDPEPKSLTVADISRRFGPIPVARIRMSPIPGTATEADFSRVVAERLGLCELVDGILVEKSVGWKESLVASCLVTLLRNFTRPKRLGTVLGPDGPIRFGPGLIRMPDVCFIARKRMPVGNAADAPILSVAPNLAVEILSVSNTTKEMQRKLKEYFKAGVELVWFVDLGTRTVEVFTAVGKSVVLEAGETLTGGIVLPGFQVAVRELFADFDE